MAANLQKTDAPADLTDTKPKPAAKAGTKREAKDDLKSLPLAEVEKKLESSPAGLTQAEAEKRLTQYGPNELEEKKTNEFLKFLTYFWGPIPWMIEAAVVLSAVARHWPDFGIILLLPISNAVVGFWEEHQAGNAIALWRPLCGEDKMPKVAILAATEEMNPKMQATTDAAILCNMADRGQIKNGILDGPLAFDNAISKQVAEEKGITSPVAGDADILLVPEIETGNVLAKQLTFLGNADAAGIVLGARVPIILTSRADSVRARLLSCALAVLIVDARRNKLLTLVKAA